jgi:hypothetical protein
LVADSQLPQRIENKPLLLMLSGSCILRAQSGRIEGLRDCSSKSEASSNVFDSVLLAANASSSLIRRLARIIRES